MLRLTRSLSRLETQDIKTQPQFNLWFLVSFLLVHSLSFCWWTNEIDSLHTSLISFLNFSFFVSTERHWSRDQLPAQRNAKRIINGIFGNQSMIFAMSCISLLGSVVWGHHMYTVGLETDTRAYFTGVTILICIRFPGILLEFPVICWHKITKQWIKDWIWPRLHRLLPTFPKLGF